MHRLIPIAVVAIFILVIAIIAVQFVYCGFVGDPASPRYYALCVADD